MSEFWWGVLIFMFYIPLLFLWGFTMFDIFSRHDLRGLAKALWAIGIVFLPLLGMLIYFIARPKEVDSWSPYANTNPYNPGVDFTPPASPGYQGTARPVGTSPADVATLSRLHDNGTLNDEEYDRMRARMAG